MTSGSRGDGNTVGDRSTYQVMVRVDEGVHERLKEISVDEERTVAQTVRLAIRQFLAGRDDVIAAS